MGFGILVFPIIGSSLVENLGFRVAIDVTSMVLLINSRVYLAATLGDWRKERRERDRSQLSQGEDERHLLREDLGGL